MRWKKFSNFIIVIVLSLAYVVMALLNAIGPLHMNATGGITKPGMFPEYGLWYLILSLIVTWGIYFLFRRNPKVLFFLSLIVGIICLIMGAFLWYPMGG